MNIRSRFRLSKVAEVFGGGIEATFDAMYDDKIPEDMRFMKATPWGTMTQRIDNPLAIAAFRKEDGSWRLGEYFYLDISPAPAY